MAALYNHLFPLSNAFTSAPSMTWPAAYQYELQPAHESQPAMAMDHPRYTQPSQKHRLNLHLKPKRKRRRKEEIERMYKCGWQGCVKAYGTLNHLNIHARLMGHGPKRLPTEFTEIRRRWRMGKQQEEESAVYAQTHYHSLIGREVLGDSHESMLAHPPPVEHQMRYLSTSVESYTPQGSPGDGMAPAQFSSGPPNPFLYSSVYPGSVNERPFWEETSASDTAFVNGAPPAEHLPLFGAYLTDTRLVGSHLFPPQRPASANPHYWGLAPGNTANSLEKSPPVDEGSDAEWRP